ncbi:MAG: zinc-binding dehydrogenase [Acidimicrobiia bacterium]
MTRQGRQMVFVGAGRPLEVRERDVADPVPGGVLLRTVLGGVCGTDAHRLDGDLPDAGRPICFGHEGIGRIEVLGDGRTTDTSGNPVAVGDLVYWTPSGRTPAEVPDTGWPPPADVPNPATYQDYATLGPENAFFRIPDGTPPEAVIAFGCAMPTACGGLTRLGGVHAGQTVVVQGSGPVGLSATLLASLAAPAVRDRDRRSTPGSRSRFATRCHHRHPVAVDDRRRAACQILDLTDGRGADVVIEATGRMDVLAEGMALLAPNGRYLVMGIYSGHGGVELDVVRLNNLSQSVIGTMGPASFDDYRTTVSLAADHGARLGFADLVTHKFPMAQTEAAIAVARKGEAIKAVVTPELG